MTLSLWTSLVAVLGVWSVTVLSPGPNFLATSYTAATQGRGRALMVVAGITVGTAIWATASLTGLSLLFQTAGWLYQIVKVAGAVFLMTIGLILIVSTWRSGAGDPPVARAAMTAGQAFRRGLIVDLANPKAAVFFTSLFAAALPPAAPLWFQALVVAAVVVIAGGWYALVACLVHLRPVATVLGRARRALDVAAGSLFCALGLRLATDR